MKGNGLAQFVAEYHRLTHTEARSPGGIAQRLAIANQAELVVGEQDHRFQTLNHTQVLLF
jgi:hypothetical protein